MSWKYLDDVLRQTDSGLSFVPLNALIPDSTEYDVMLYQHQGSVDASPDGVRNQNSTLAEQKFRALFNLAVKKRPDLLTTPEYSCPWSVIEECIVGENWPAEGKLWVVGCESILPDELTALQLRHTNTQWLSQTFKADRDQKFLDPVCILLNAKDLCGAIVRVLAVQVKGCPMADQQQRIEPDSLILGSDRYILRNNDSSIQLAVMICSDSLEPNIYPSLPQHALLPYLLLHVQLNPDPRHVGFREYRDFWGIWNRDKTEIVTLNWARGSQVLSQAFSFGGSAWYFKTGAEAVSDADISRDHRHGSYYAYSGKRYFHCQMFNYSEHVFHIRTRKIEQVESPPSRRVRRAGPRSVGTYSWNSTQWTLDNPDDGFAALCNSIHPQLLPLPVGAESEADKERLICLSSGHIKSFGRHPWHHPMALPSFSMTADEVCNRVTFCHDPDQGSYDLRRLRLNRFKVLKSEILGPPVRPQFPRHLAELRDNGSIKYPAVPGAPAFNVFGDYPAVFIYVGEDSEAQAKEKMMELYATLAEAARSLVVWYRDGSELKHVCPQGLDTFDADLGDLPNQYTSGKP